MRNNADSLAAIRRVFDQAADHITGINCCRGCTLARQILGLLDDIAELRAEVERLCANQLPVYLHLGGDEDGGVTLTCCHTSCDGEPLAYHTSWDESQAQGLRYFGIDDLDGFVAFAREHAAQHAERAS